MFHLTHVMCPVSHVRGHVTHFTCHLSLRPTAQPNNLPLLTPPLLQWAALQRPQKPKKKFKRKNH